MKLTLQPTDQIDTIEGQPSRVWTGFDQDGVAVKAWIRMVSPQTHDPAVNAAFAEQLQALPRLGRAATAIDWRFIL